MSKVWVVQEKMQCCGKSKVLKIFAVHHNAINFRTEKEMWNTEELFEYFITEMEIGDE